MNKVNVTYTLGVWTERPEFKAFFSQARELCEELQPRTLVRVATSE